MTARAAAVLGWARGGSTPRLIAGAVALALVALGVGVGLAWIGDRFGPVWILGVPALGLVAAIAVALPVVAGALVLAAMPIGLQPVPGTPLDLLEVVVLVAVVAIAAWRVDRGMRPLPIPRAMWWAILLLGLVLVASVEAVDPAAAFKQDLQLAAGVLLALAVVGCARSLSGVLTLLATALGMALIVGALALTDIDSQRSSFGGAVIEGRAQGVFEQPNELGAFAAMMFILALGTALTPVGRPLRVLAGCAAAASAAALLVSFSRGAWIGAALGLVALFALLPRARRGMLAVALAALVAAALLAVLRPEEPQVQIARERIGSVLEPEANPYDPRPALWREGRRQASESPLLGVGPGGFREAASRADSVARVDVPHAHNAVLTVAAEAGIPAAAALIALTLAAGLTLARAARRLGRSGHAAHAALVASLAAALTTVVGHGLVDYTLRNGVLFLLAWFLLGLGLAAAAIRVPNRAQPPATLPDRRNARRRS